VVVKKFLIEAANAEYVRIIVKADPVFLALHHDLTPFFVLVDTLDRIG